MKKIIAFVKKETVLTIAWILAAFSAILVPPSSSYVNYIDFKSLGTLWSLMVIMEGLKRLGVFRAIGLALLQRTHMVWQLVTVLVALCFFFSMLITNDVALLTFVPFSIFMLELCSRTDLLIPTIVLQTVAANLGSMLTPIGNPQNLYLYSQSNMTMLSFIRLMLPYTLLTAFLLGFSILLLKGKTDPITVALNDLANEKKPLATFSEKITCGLYFLLFLLSLLIVGHVFPYYVLVGCVLIFCLLADRTSLWHIDYALLLTFIGFFIFTGNLGNLQAVRSLFTRSVGGHEVVAGILASQVISNVPAALLLSDFSTNLSNLIIGVNLGGLGTLIASMASLISFKLLAHSHNELKGQYFLQFTLTNLLFLGILFGSVLLYQ